MQEANVAELAVRAMNVRVQEEQERKYFAVVKREDEKQACSRLRIRQMLFVFSNDTLVHN